MKCSVNAGEYRREIEKLFARKGPAMLIAKTKFNVKTRRKNTMKKKLLPFILGCSMLAALPLTAHADETTLEQNSGNVTYNGFAAVLTTESGDTPVLTAIPECTMTIPRDTTIKRGSLSANIGKVTIDGKYFVKPYYVEVTADRKSFTLVDTTTGIAKTEAAALAKEDIIFDVATTTGAPSTETGENHSAADETTFVKSGAIDIDSNNKTTQNKTRAARRFWKDETIATAADQDKNYLAGEITPINGQNDVFVNIGATQWTGKTDGTAEQLANTKPVGGKYSGNITFTATFKDDFATGMPVWKNLT